MGETTEIAWCDHTMNPWIGCTKISDGCTNCYAAVDTFARASRGAGLELWGPKAARHRTSVAYWKQPLRWARKAAAEGVRRRVFCASLADVFEDRRDLDPWRADLWRLIEATPALDWLLLTKRPENLARMLPAAWLTGRAGSPLKSHVWLGTTAEDQRRAEERIPHLLAVPAAVRFISAEPLLEAVDFFKVPTTGTRIAEYSPRNTALGDLDWVIIGGESGPGARPFALDWARRILRDCAAAGVAAFMKQAGAAPFDVDGLSQSFATFQQWVDKGKSWLASGRWVLTDVRGRRCLDGSDMMRARDEEAFPVAASPLLKLRDKKGGDLSELPAEFNVRQFPEARS